jgi:hypothetical protein
MSSRDATSEFREYWSVFLPVMGLRDVTLSFDEPPRSGV